MGEYSYFRAEGESLKVVETVMAARKEVKDLSERLAKKYGAEAFVPWPDRQTFMFPRGSKIPESFEAQKRYKEDESQPIFAWAKPGTQDAFNVASVMGLMQLAINNSRFEGAFGCSDMPMKQITHGGYYCGAFVRETTPVGPDDTYKQGLVHDGMNISNGYNGLSSFQTSDPIMALQLFGDWYIRIPNDPEGKPRFVPPGGKLMDYADMLAIDRREFNRFRSESNAQYPPRL